MFVDYLMLGLLGVMWGVVRFVGGLGDRIGVMM